MVLPLDQVNFFGLVFKRESRPPHRVPGRLVGKARRCAERKEGKLERTGLFVSTTHAQPGPHE